MKTVQRLVFGAAIALLSPLVALKPASALGIFGSSTSCVADPYRRSVTQQ